MSKISTFAEKLQVLQAQQKLGLAKADAKDARKGALGKSLTEAGKNLSGPVGSIVSGLGAGMGIRGAFDQRKEPSSKEKLLEGMEAQLSQLQAVQVEAEKRAKTQKDLQKVAVPSLQILGKMKSGQISQEEGNNLLTANARAIYGEGSQVLVDPATQLVTVFDGEGSPIAQTYPLELASLTGLPAEQQSALTNEYTNLATTKGEIKGQESLAEARTVAEGVGGGIGDVRVGVGLDRPIERTQEIPFTGSVVPQAITARSGGLIQNPYQLQRLNEQELPLYRDSLKKANEQATNSAGVVSNMQSVLNILDDPANKGKSLSGFGQGAVNLVKNIASELELGEIKPNTGSQQIQSLITDAAVGRMKDLGGNDSQQELERIESIAGTLSDPEDVLRSKATAVRGVATKLALKSDFLSKYTEQNPALINRAESAYSRAVRSIDPRQPAAQIEKQLSAFLDPEFKPALNEAGFMKTTTSTQESATAPTSNVVDWNSL